MLCTGQTITFMPFARVAVRTASRPGIDATAEPATVAGTITDACNEPKLFFIPLQSICGPFASHSRATCEAGRDRKRERSPARLRSACKWVRLPVLQGPFSGSSEP